MDELVAVARQAPEAEREGESIAALSSSVLRLCRGLALQKAQCSDEQLGPGWVLLGLKGFWASFRPQKESACEAREESALVACPAGRADRPSGRNWSHFEKVLPFPRRPGKCWSLSEC